MFSHKQVDFSGGLNYLADAAKIKPDEYYFLSNARTRDGGVIPIKLPERITLGLPSLPILDIGVTDPGTGSPPPITTTTELPPTPPPYPTEPTSWPVVPPFTPTTLWPPPTKTMYDPPTYPPIVAPVLEACASQQVYEWKSRPWMPANIAGPIRAPSVITQGQNPNEILTAAILTWWESKLVADFIDWAENNGVFYDAYETYWEWDDSATGINAVILHDTGTYQLLNTPGWEMKLAYCETAGVGMFVRIRYYNVGNQCSDSVLSGILNEVTEFPPNPVVFAKEQGPVINPSIPPQTYHNVFLARFDQAFLDFGGAEAGQAYQLVARHYNYDPEIEACDLGTEFVFQATYAEIIAQIIGQAGQHNGSLSDPYLITRNVS